MNSLEQLPCGTIIEFRRFADWMGYASAMGYHLDSQAAQRSGFCRMRHDIGVVANVTRPPYFTYDIVG
jgi:hypothetical protein